MSTFGSWAVDALERAGKTIVQTFAATLITLGVSTNWTSWWHALDIALLAGVVSILTSVISIPLSQTLNPAVQVAFRALLTFAQSALGFLAANTFLDLTSVPWLQVLTVSLVAAVTSVLTSLASWPVGPAKGNPSLVANTAPVGSTT